jgi:hypothetical protein
MKTTRGLINTLKCALVLPFSIGALVTISSTVLADDDHGDKSNPLYIKGYQVYTNVVFLNPANRALLEVRTGGEGGISHLGKMRSWSVDQEVNLVTGDLTAHYTFQDKDGDKLLFMATAAPSSVQPDGRVTFEGSFTVTGGTGRFKHAKGTLHFEGWARTTDFVTSAGIGFGSIEGVLEGTKIDEAEPFAFTDKGTGVVNPPNFAFSGDVDANQLGDFKDAAQSTPGPFLAQFVGIVDGRFTLIESYDSTWNGKKDDRLNFSAVEIISFEAITLPDHSIVPDLTKPYRAQTYMTVKSGKGHFKHAQGVAFGKFNIVPTGPTTVASEQRGVGFLSNDDKD